MTSILTITANTIITKALLKAGIVPQEQTINDADFEGALNDLNFFLKSLQADGFHLWTITEGTIFLEKGKESYNIGFDGDHSAETFINTASTAAALIAATTLTVPTTGMTGAADILNDPTDSVQDWTIGATGVITSANDALTLTNGANAQGTASFSLATTVGEKYLVNVLYTKASSSGAIFDILDDVASTVLATSTLTANGTVSLSFTATQTTHTFRLKNRSSAITEDSTISLLVQLDTDSGDFIGIELDDGTRQWTNIVTVDSATQVTLNDALTAAAASGNTVFSYTDKLDRPLRIIDARSKRLPNQFETPLNNWNRTEYFEQPDKTSQGTVTNFYYSPQLNTGKLFTWQTADSVKQILNVTFVRPIDIVLNNADALDIPAEWGLALIWSLAAELLPGYKIDPPRQQILDDRASFYLDQALGFDHEFASMFIGVDRRDG